MTALLVVTAGRTDVQLVTSDGRCEFNKDSCAAIHDELENRPKDWTILERLVKKTRGSKGALPSPPFQVCTPKLEAVLNYVSEHHITVTRALILDTRRDPGVEREEPRYAGAILAKRLRNFGCKEIQVASYLRAGERLADWTDRRGGVIRQDAVERINRAVRDAIRDCTWDRIVVASTGGMTGTAALVEEVVRLHAGKNPIELLEVHDSSKDKPLALDRAVPRSSVPEPAESFRARRHALDLIVNGNFLAAWGAVKHLDADPVERRWTRVMQWLYQFAASLPPAEDCDIDVLKHPQMAVQAAIRVELALRSGDIPRAVHGTVAFFESALWDHLWKRVTLVDQESKLYRVPDPPQELIGSGEDGKPFVPASCADGMCYEIWDNAACAGRLAKNYLKRPGLIALNKVMKNARKLRNDVSHNQPTPELMAKASEEMAQIGLWKGAEPCTFLSQPLVQNVLKELGEPNPKLLCENLLETVRAHVLLPSAEAPK